MTLWKTENNYIFREFSFNDFKEALGFVNEVGKLAEKKNHHPDIFLYDYKKVRITLSTHSEGRVTDKDYALAKLIDMIL